jgi:hypothetical protein
MNTITKHIKEIENEIKKTTLIVNNYELGFSIRTELSETILKADKIDILTNENALINDLLTIKTIIPKNII